MIFLPYFAFHLCQTAWLVPSVRRISPPPFPTCFFFLSILFVSRLIHPRPSQQVNPSWRRVLGFFDLYRVTFPCVCCCFPKSFTFYCSFLCARFSSPPSLYPHPTCIFDICPPFFHFPFLLWPNPFPLLPSRFLLPSFLFLGSMQPLCTHSNFVHSSHRSPVACVFSFYVWFFCPFSPFPRVSSYHATVFLIFSTGIHCRGKCGCFPPCSLARTCCRFFFLPVQLFFDVFPFFFLGFVTHQVGRYCPGVDTQLFFLFSVSFSRCQPFSPILVLSNRLSISSFNSLV